MKRGEKKMSLEHDDDGKIIPTDAAIFAVERDYADRSPAERWRLAQAQTLIDSVKEENDDE